MRLYGLKTCDTCRAALRALAEAKLDVTFVDVRDDPVHMSLLTRALAEFGDALINRRSTTWRSLDEAERALDPLDLIQANPTLMKRPLIEVNDQLYLGWTEAVRTSLIP